LGFGGSVEGVKLVVFYFLSASEFWPKKEGWSLMGVAPLEGVPLKRGYSHQRPPLFSGQHSDALRK
jgi:hypothetical protein